MFFWNIFIIMDIFLKINFFIDMLGYELIVNRLSIFRIIYGRRDNFKFLEKIYNYLLIFV